METHRGSRHDKPARTSAAPSAEAASALPARKAFVVQFSIGTSGGDTQSFAGRVEHLRSGRRARFSSATELLASLQRMLQQLADDQS